MLPMERSTYKNQRNHVLVDMMSGCHYLEIIHVLEGSIRHLCTATSR